MNRVHKDDKEREVLSSSSQVASRGWCLRPVRAFQGAPSWLPGRGAGEWLCSWKPLLKKHALSFKLWILFKWSVALNNI